MNVKASVLFLKAQTQVQLSEAIRLNNTSIIATLNSAIENCDLALIELDKEVVLPAETTDSNSTETPIDNGSNPN